MSQPSPDYSIFGGVECPECKARPTSASMPAVRDTDNGESVRVRYHCGNGHVWWQRSEQKASWFKEKT